MVRAPPRYCGGRMRQRQLLGGGCVAAIDGALYCDGGLARYLHRCRAVLHLQHGLAGLVNAPGSTQRGSSHGAIQRGPAARTPFRPTAQYRHSRAVRSRPVLLRGHGHAAGAYRGLLHRPGFWRGAGCANAVHHAGLRHRQPPGLGRAVGPHRRHPHAGAGLGAAVHSAAAVSTL